MWSCKGPGYKDPTKRELYIIRRQLLAREDGILSAHDLQYLQRKRHIMFFIMY